MQVNVALLEAEYMVHRIANLSEDSDMTVRLIGTQMVQTLLPITTQSLQNTQLEWTRCNEGHHFAFLRLLNTLTAMLGLPFGSVLALLSHYINLFIMLCALITGSLHPEQLPKWTTDAKCGNSLL